MRIALCLHGLFREGKAGHKHLTEALVGHDVDVYVHSWDPSKSEEIRELYNPVVSYFEPQRTFEEELDFLDEDWFNEGFDRTNSPFNNCKLFYTLSFLYSRQWSISSALQQKKKYDCVVTCRYDIGQRGGSEVNQFYLPDKPKGVVGKFPYPGYVYGSDWDQHNAGYPDMWFYGDEVVMRKVADVYDVALRAFKKGSGYEDQVTLGWPDSEMMDNDNPHDPKQFSDVRHTMFWDGTEPPLMKYPKWQCINNHLFYKYAFMQLGLYKKSRFVKGNNVR